MKIRRQVIPYEMLPGKAGKAVGKQDGKRKKLSQGAISGKALWRGTSA